MSDETQFPLFEADVARLLVGALGDDDLWGCVAARGHSQAQMNALAQRAATLYRRTESTLSMRLDAQAATEIDYAIGLLRDIADVCAILSREWSADQAITLGVTTRSEFSNSIVTYHLDRWAERQGVRTQLVPGLPAPRTSRQTSARHLSIEDFAARFTATIDAYPKIEALHAADRGSEVLGKRTFRDAAAGDVKEARAWLSWMRDHAPTEAHGAGVAMLLVAEASFVASCEDTPGAKLFPSQEVVSLLISASDAYDWLVSNRIRIPHWIVHPST